MLKILTLAAALLISAAGLQAQQGETGQSARKSANLTTIEGCLSNSSGQYFVTDGSGTKHELSGYSNKLKAHVGHEVQITGKPSIRTEADTSYGAASSAEEIPVFEVKTVRQVADACKSK
jgi:hypothetical protein